MKLSDHVEHIRQLIESAFRNRLGRMGISATNLSGIETIPAEYHTDRARIQTIHEVLLAETGTLANAWEKLIEEFTFTLFNRIAALKVMEAHTLHPEIITRRSQHGDRSFAHKNWLEQNPDGHQLEMEGLVNFLHDQLAELSAEIPLFNLLHPYHLLPTAIELNAIINAFNEVDSITNYEYSITNKTQNPDSSSIPNSPSSIPNSQFLIPNSIWQSDDILGWLYESYNNYKKAAHKESGLKTEFNKVSIQSQVYTPRWVVKFLVDNSLGKLYLEMFPDSNIRNLYKIANAPTTQTRTPKPLTEIKLIDPAPGSGNFLLYAFDLFYDLYTDQIENYGADYNERKIPELIIAHNLHGIDLDDRAIQLAQLGLYIKAKRKRRSAKIDHFNIVSSDFFLPPYAEVKHLFQSGAHLNAELEGIVTDLWADLQQAFKFGSLLRIEEKFSLRLHDLVQQFDSLQLRLFSEESLVSYDQFRENFFANLQKALTQNTAKQGQNFLNTKTQDAITYLQLLTQKYDVAVANPPFTDSADFGPELKKFIDSNYSRPFKYNSNLYATFIKKAFDLVNNDGFIAMIHPYSFMFIKTFEDVRKLMINQSNIEILVEHGLDRVNLFEGGYASASAYYILKKNAIANSKGVFIRINSGQQEREKKQSFLDSVNDLIENKKNVRIFKINKQDFRAVKSWPLIYWISNDFRKKFDSPSLDDVLDARQGIATGNNERFLRFWWEVNRNSITNYDDREFKKWIFYQKGGAINKWYGNNWAIINYDNSAYKILKESGNHLPSEKYYFKEGITYTFSGSRASFRYLMPNQIFDVSGSSIFTTSKYQNIYYTIGFLNSRLSDYILDCLNPTASTQVGDLKRIPFAIPSKEVEEKVDLLCKINIEIKKELCSFKIEENNFNLNPIVAFPHGSINNRSLYYLNFVNYRLTQALLNEAIINQLVTKVYELSEEDRLQVEEKMGKPVGELPVFNAAREAYLSEHGPEQEIVKRHIANLEAIEFDVQQIQVIKSEFGSLYQSNNDLEAFCIRHQVNPINVWYWFKQSRVLPQARAAEIALEFLADAFRTILMEDEDGIIPLVGLPGEPRLMDRFEEYCYNQGFTSAQIMQLDGLTGRPLNEYIEHHFFKNFSDHLNLFMYLPKTPFIWHLSSGTQQGFEAYIIIYKWNRDSLYKIKSSYLSKRTESLQYRLQQIADSTSAQSQTEKETVRLQLLEIETFARKIDELIAQGYDPKLDDGVGKNIAPLQSKGMLRAEVLNKKQLEKYLKADW